MQNLLNDLSDLLKKDDRFVSDGKLIKNNVIEAALQVDPGLIKLLLSNKTFKKHFFTDIDDVLVFDKIEFQKFVSNKSFLKDSYTSFSNKIGLTTNDEFISERKEVVLSWPHKDCVLEGGQTKEDEKRDEIFWNDTLAPDEIDRLLSPKVFTNFKKYDSKGEHKVTDISLEDNLIIKGNNLLALHSLVPVYGGRIKLIYIDPPYNTGNDSFQYNDDFNHSTWLTFMKSRLEIARELLDLDGSIFIQIDDFEDAYLKVLMDEIFGRENFRNKITWKRRGGSANPSNRMNNVVDYILWYSKTSSFNYKPIFTLDDENTQKYIKERFVYKDENNRIYMRSPLQSPNPRPNLIYNYKGYKSPLKGWSISLEIMKKWDEEGKLYFPKDKSQNINRKIYLDEYQGQPVSCLWSDIKVINPMAKERGEFENGQKPEALIQRMIEMTTKENDLVLDFFVGSGTSCAVAHKMKRRYIGIEQLEYIESITKKRLREVVKGDETGISKSVNWIKGGSFVYCELTELNKIFIDQIKSAKTTKELKSIWSSIKKDGFISYQVTPSEIDKNISEFEEFSLTDQKKFLIEVLDKNHLYVNYSEIEDKDYNISTDDKKLNKKFYSLK
jgi:adenine-specific DNA-methyltransferase